MKMLGIALSFMLFASGGTPDALAAQQDTLRLSLEEAIRLAKEENPAFLTVRNDVSDADWEVRSAYGALFPSASLASTVSWQGAGEQRFGSVTLAQDLPSYYLSSYSIGIAYQLSGSTLLAPSAARARRDAVTAQVSAAEFDLVAAVTRAYLEVLRLREVERLADLRLDRARANRRLALTLAQVGADAPLDVRQAEVQVGRAEVAELQAGNMRSTARLELLELIGLAEDLPLVLSTVFEVHEPDWDEETLFETAFEQNPTLRARAASLDASRVQVRQARSAYLPSLTAQAGISGRTRQASSAFGLINLARMRVADELEQCELFNQIYMRLTEPLTGQDCARFRFTDEMRDRIIAENNAFPFDFSRQPAFATLTLTLPVFQGLARGRQLEAARVQRSDAEHQVRAQRNALRIDLTIALRTVTTAYRSVTLGTSNREVANEQLRLAGERYRLGAISFVDLVDAETVKIEADQAFVNAEYAYHNAITQLETVVGTRLRE